MFRSVAELVERANKDDILISEVMIRQEMDTKEVSREEVYNEMEKNLIIMENAIEDSLKGITSVTGLTGGDAVRIQTYMENHTPLSGGILLDAVSKAMGTNEVNAAVVAICATRTAGTAVCVPRTLFAVKER